MTQSLPCVRAVIFDIGNVLIAWNPEAYYDRIVGRDRRIAFFDQIAFFDLMNQMDAGAPFAETIEDWALANPEWGAELRMLRDNWCDVAQPAIDHSVRLLAALRARETPVFALTNFGSQNFPLSVAQFPFLGTFDRTYVSGDMGLIKPDPAIYAAVEADCGLPPQSLLFADDRAENIAAARARGWQGHLFEHPQGWADRLVAAGLLSAEEAQ